MLVAPAKLALFTAAALALIVTPGPAVLYIVTRSVSQGRRAGFLSALGVGLGNAVHAAACAGGLAAVLASSELAFAAVKWLGAGYLVVLGISKLAGRGGAGLSQDAAAAPRAADRAVFGQGLAVAVLNPKTALFFIAFLPQFVDPSRGAAWAQLLFLGGLFVVLAIASDCGYAALAGSVGAWLRRHPAFASGERWVGGSV
ncbi:MAG TPA: LysE family translocator, partial [Anaeromyxobacteraceae bacterium]|nr:LysE family translocator [Anaeromyxobacteraceae bacterium]